MARKRKINETLYCPKCGNKGLIEWNEFAESGKQRRRCPSCGFRTTKVLNKKSEILPETKVSAIRKNTRFLISSAVNDTNIVGNWYQTFLNIANNLDAIPIIIPTVYKNPDLFHRGYSDGYSWPLEIHKYICNKDVILNGSLIIRGSNNSRIPYTSINPLSGLDNTGHIQSEIYGHQQVAMRLTPTAHEFLPKMLHTTGTLSEHNYGKNKTAGKASKHHSLSALFIEIEKDSFWPTEVHFDGTGAYLFNKYYTPDTVSQMDSIPGIVYGDIHIRFLEKIIHDHIKYFGKVFNPQYQVFHDVHDHHIKSHHYKGDILFSIWKNSDKEFSVRDELELSNNFLQDKENAVIIRANHHDHLDKWFNNFKPAFDDVNVDLYFELGAMAVEDLKNGGDGHLFRLFLQKYCNNNLKFVQRNEYFAIAGIDCSQHGDIGGNGSKGNAALFTKSGHKSMIGHSHSPRIEKSCYQVGTLSTPPYARGYGSWMKTCGFIYANGKCSLHNIVKNKLSPIMRKLGNENI